MTGVREFPPCPGGRPGCAGHCLTNNVAKVSNNELATSRHRENRGLLRLHGRLFDNTYPRPVQMIQNRQLKDPPGNPQIAREPNT